MSEIKGGTNPRVIIGTGSINSYSFTPISYQQNIWTTTATSILNNQDNNIDTNAPTSNWWSPVSYSTNFVMSCSMTSGPGNMCIGFGVTPVAFVSSWRYTWQSAQATGISGSTATGAVAGDRLAISYDGSMWRWYRNGTLVRSESAEPAPYAFQGCMYRGQTGITNIFIKDLTAPPIYGSASVAKLKTSSPVQTGGQLIAPTSYSLTPWRTGSGGPWTVTANSVQQAPAITRWDYIWPTVQPGGTNLSLQIKIDNYLNHYTHFGFIDTIPSSGTSSVNHAPRVAGAACMCLVNGGAGGGNFNVDAYIGNVSQAHLTNQSNSSTFKLTYDGLVYRWYVDATLVCGYSSSNDARNQMFINQYYYGGTVTNIQFGQLYGGTTPSLPQSVIKFV